MNQSSVSSTSTNWSFRPSALALQSTADIYTIPPFHSRQRLEECYEEDNRRAINEGIKILSPPNGDKSNNRIRTLQWNINSGYHIMNSAKNDVDIQTGIVNTIRDTNADFIVLNEYVDVLDADLHRLGYHNITMGTVDFPTVVATRLHIIQQKEIILSYDRSAILTEVLVEEGGDNDKRRTNESVWIIGTHINFQSGKQRNIEMQILMKEIDKMNIINDDKPCCLLGDLNQQRSRDYSSEEWARITGGMKYRNATEDDGVANMLMSRGFVCCWDTTLPSVECDMEDEATSNAAEEKMRKKDSIVNVNWDTAYAPATHWSGTIVDYSYGLNISPLYASIGPDNWSDHRLTVVDWTW